MYIRRNIETRLVQNLERNETMVLVGPRQAGKTTILKHLKEILDRRGEITFFINLEKKQFLNMLNENPENLFKLTGNLPDRKVYAIIDEIQYLDDPANFLKYMYDEYAGKLKLIVSGSSAFYIDQKFKDSLAGRKRMFELRVLDFREFLVFKDCGELAELFTENPLLQKRQIPGLHADKLNRLFLEFMRFGAFPGVVLEKTEAEKIDLLDELLNSYLGKDLETMGIRKKDKFYDLLRLLAGQVGNLVNQSELASTLRISVTAVENYLHILDKSFQVKKITPFYLNLRKELTRMPKLYFLDPGIRNILLDNFDPPEFRMDKGMYWENTIFKLLHDRDDVKTINFWRTQDQNEVDFIINKKFALEAKFNGDRFSPTGYKQFSQSYPEIPLRAASFLNPKPDHLTFFDLI
jgi:predicted AAA+ superfamily ATPase